MRRFSLGVRKVDLSRRDRAYTGPLPQDAVAPGGEGFDAVEVGDEVERLELPTYMRWRKLLSEAYCRSSRP